jgi:uncharacterized protein (DUF1697 family)
MPSYVALLRGINVGGKRSLPMEKVRTAFERAGAAKVTTYIQSGNVVFTHDQRSAAALIAKLESTLEDAAGFAVPIVLRTRAEWAAAIEANPYKQSETVHCAFLPAAPTKEQSAKVDLIDRNAHLPSQLAVHVRQIYLDLPAGIGNDKFASAVLRIFPDATVRNWRTVGKLAEMLGQLSSGN